MSIQVLSYLNSSIKQFVYLSIIWGICISSLSFDFLHNHSSDRLHTCPVYCWGPKEVCSECEVVWMSHNHRNCGYSQRKVFCLLCLYIFFLLVRIWSTYELSGLTRYNLNCEGSCTVLPCCSVHSLKLQGDKRPISYTQNSHRSCMLGSVLDSCVLHQVTCSAKDSVFTTRFRMTKPSAVTLT